MVLYTNVHYFEMKKQILVLILEVFSVLGSNSQPKNITQEDTPIQWGLIPIPSETGSIGFGYRFKQYLILNKLVDFIIGNNMGAEISKSVEQNVIKP